MEITTHQFDRPRRLTLSLAPEPRGLAEFRPANLAAVTRPAVGPIALNFGRKVLLWSAPAGAHVATNSRCAN